MNISRFFGVFSLFILTLPAFLLAPFSVYFDPRAEFAFLPNIAAFITLFGLFAWLLWRLTDPKSTRRSWLKLLLLAALPFGIVGFSTALSPIYMPRQIGAPAVYLAFIGFVLFLFYSLWRTQRGLFALVVVGIFVAITVREIDRPVQETLRAVPESANLVNRGEGVLCFSENPVDCETDIDAPIARSECDYEGCAFAEWLLNRPDLAAYEKAGRAYPVYLVSAAGGGIYAASHAYALLNRINTHCPSFKQHIFAISAVSGGSFGSMQFALDPSSEAPITTLPECKLEVQQETAPKFAQDFFSPILASFIYSNILEFFIPLDFGISESATTLESVFVKTLANPALTQNIKDLWSPKANRPAIFYNTTNLTNGRTNLISPFPLLLGQAEASGRAYGLNQFAPVLSELSPISAASLSARFPFITPSGSIKREVVEKWEEDGTPIPEMRKTVYLDGGYIDNTGAAALRVIMAEISQDETEDFDVEACSENGSETPQCDYVSSGAMFDACSQLPETQSCNKYIWQSKYVPIEIFYLSIDAFQRRDPSSTQSFLDPLFAMLSVRVARGEIERQSYIFDQCGPAICHDTLHPDYPVLEHVLDNDDLSLPLTWSLGRRNYQAILDNLGQPGRCDLGELSGENDCEILAIVDQLMDQ